jgi:hypothetical protein
MLVKSKASTNRTCTRAVTLIDVTSAISFHEVSMYDEIDSNGDSSYKFQAVQTRRSPEYCKRSIETCCQTSWTYGSWGASRLVVAGAYVAFVLYAARRRTWRFGSYPDVRVALTPVMWHWLRARYRAADAMEEIAHLVPDLASIVLKPLERVLDLLVEAKDELLNAGLD